MILRSRYLARAVPVAVVLLAGSAGFATAHASTTPNASAAPLVVGTSYFVSPFGLDTNDCLTAASPCATVQHAVVLDVNGGTITLAPGAYVEQVSADHGVTIVGAGQDESTIEAPASLATNSQTPAVTAIVDITGPTTTVSMSKLTVAGPGPQGGGLNCGVNPSSLDKGIDVHDGGTLNLSAAAVRNVTNLPNNGCQRGDAISIGSECFSCTAGIGHATLTSVKVSVYQKNGIAVRGVGSTLHVTGGTVANNPNSLIASNGIEVVSGAVAVVAGTTVTGNQCKLAPACGPNPFTDTMADGVLISGSGPGTQFTGLKVSNNDQGIYTDDGVKLTGDNASNNLYNGIFVNVTAAHALIQNDTANHDGAYGIITLSGNFNKFSNDTATGNTTDDLDAVISGSDTNTYAGNHSSKASPSKGYWHSS